MQKQLQQEEQSRALPQRSTQRAQLKLPIHRPTHTSTAGGWEALPLQPGFPTAGDPPAWTPGESPELPPQTQHPRTALTPRAYSKK